jgi:hypothetical protein
MYIRMSEVCVNVHWNVGGVCKCTLECRRFLQMYIGMSEVCVNVHWNVGGLCKCTLECRRFV